MKNLLIITPWLPYPLNGGGNQAMYNGIAAVKDSYNTHVLYIDFMNDRHSVDRSLMQKHLGNVEISCFVFNNKNTRYKALKWLHTLACNRFLSNNKDYRTDRMLQSFSPIPEEFSDYINEYIIRNQIDIVQTEMIAGLPIVLSLPMSVKKIFVHHELRYVVNNLALNSIGHSLYRDANMSLAKIMEVGLLNLYDHIITLSPIDTEKLKKEGVRTPISSSFAIVNSKNDYPILTDNYNVLTFVGPSSHGPNYMGIQWFLENCWDNLKKSDNSYKLKIIGKWDESAKQDISSKYKDIEFLGFVEDLAESLRNTIMIVPITVGSGIRMKILEASSFGVPFVSTTVGAEGIPVIDGRNCLLADTPQDFVNAIIRLKDKDLRIKILSGANQMVKHSYSMLALKENRDVIYKNLF